MKISQHPVPCSRYVKASPHGPRPNDRNIDPRSRPPAKASSSIALGTDARKNFAHHRRRISDHWLGLKDFVAYGFLPPVTRADIKNCLVPRAHARGFMLSFATQTLIHPNQICLRPLQGRIHMLTSTQGGARFTRLPWAILFVPFGDGGKPIVFETISPFRRPPTTWRG